jgi:hypothetical protein
MHLKTARIHENAAVSFSPTFLSLVFCLVLSAIFDKM